MVLSIGDLAGPPASPAGSAQLWLSAGGNIHIGWAMLGSTLDHPRFAHLV
jgi:hypothetical protein